MSTDSQKQFSWDQARKEIQQGSASITEAKKDMIKLNISTFQCWYNCEKLKQQLIQLLEKLEVQLKLCGKYIQFRANQFKNKIQNLMLSKYLMNMNSSVKILLGTCAIVLVVTGGILGVEYAAVIGALSVGTRTGLKYALGISTGVGVLLVAGDILYSLWQASKNEEKFKNAIKATKQALKYFEEKKKDL